MSQEIKVPLDFKNVGKIVNLPDGVDPQDAATVHQLGSVGSSLKYKGSWNANTNIITSADLTINGDPIPAASTDNEGWYFIVDTDGATSEGGITDWKANDWIVSIGSAWVKVNNNGGGGGGGTWGSISGTLADQTDLQAELDLLQSEINAVNPVGNKLFNYYNFI